MTAILGISAFFHDSAAALVRDGDIVAAAQEERFSRKKHDDCFPQRAAAYCLQEADLTPSQLDYVVFYDKPLIKFERLLETYLAYAPRGFRSFCKAIPVWLGEKLHLRRVIRRALRKGHGLETSPIGGGRFQGPLVFVEHHESHAASAFFPSPFEEAAILTLDGVGEWATAALGTGAGHKIELTRELHFPHSLGLLYSAFTYYCGFRVNSGEYKLMGLAPYGRPIYVDLIYKHLLDLTPDGSFRLNMRYFNYCQGSTMTARGFHKLFGGPPRKPESNIEQRHMDLAASVQTVTEEIVLRIARDLHERTGMKNLVMAGGVALNCVANGRLLREGPFERIWIQPAAGDAGGALGGALFVWHQLLAKPRTIEESDSQKGSLLGPAFSTQAIQAFLQQKHIHCETLDDTELPARVAAELAAGKVIGWFQGRMEFGPRALGNRSVLADPRSEQMQSRLNLKIKYRESFRPFAPAVLREHASEWFELAADRESPYMLLTADVKEKHRLALGEDQLQALRSDPDLRRRVNIPRSTIPAVTHIDCSARLQTVDRERNPRFHALLTAFYELTGCPVLVNTSFNVRGEPIVCTPEDAWRCFLATEMDTLVLENCLVDKGWVEDRTDNVAKKRLPASFALD